MSYQLTIAHKPGTIECDFKGLNAYVESQIQKYDGLVVTEEQIKDAEKNMADLNKMKDLIEDRRKEIKKEITIPYTEFEKNIKPIVKRIDEVRGKIKEQVDAFKEQEKAEKKKRICDWWKENGKQNIPIEKIWNEQWLNKGTSDKQWQADLKQRKVLENTGHKGQHLCGNTCKCSTQKHRNNRARKNVSVMSERH